MPFRREIFTSVVWWKYAVLLKLWMAIGKVFLLTEVESASVAVECPRGVVFTFILLTNCNSSQGKLLYIKKKERWAYLQHLNSEKLLQIV